MRLVHDLAQLPHALAGARREAESAFGDGALMLERLVEDAHHVEVQVFADSHGRVVHLGERDCSAQRRRQKLIEETPSPVVDAALRERMGRDAVAAARAVGYVGAGTVEFIVDARRAHWFLEMNTRLQVEHPVTEAVTGIDLVEWQLRVAAGEPLPLEQHEIRFEGHAIEARLYAEDPYDGFKPQTGRIGAWRAPAGDGIRVDAGIAAGGEVTSHYDALLAKVIAHGRDRGEAIGRLVHALDDTLLAGVRHNARFLRELLLHARFADATLTTATLDAWPETAAAGGRASEHRDPADAGDPRATLLRRPAPPEPLWRIAAALRHGGGWRPASVASFDLTLQCDGATRVLRALPPGVRLLARDGVDAEVEVDGVRCRVAAVDDGDSLHLHADGLTFKFSEPSPWPAAEKVADPARARAPVAGVVAQVLVGPGQQVAAGQPLASVEAMKMELWLHAAAAGTVRAVHAAAKDSVAAGALIVELDVVP
jgi:geranyl-CoA carboxylase alpha subunit